MDINNPYGTTILPTSGNSPSSDPTPAVMPPADGIIVNLPLTGVQPFVADVTRSEQAKLGLVDVNPSRRDPAVVGRTLGPLPQNYAYDTAGNRTAMLGFNHAMWQLISQIDPLVEKKLVHNPRFWHDRIPRGQFQLHDGVVHQSRIFRAGLQKYAGLDEWEAIDPVPSLHNDPCAFPKHGTTTYDWDQLAWSGMRAAWGSDPICSNAFRYLKDAAQQLALILEVGMEQGVQMQETFNRDTYLAKATDFGRSYVMSNEFRGPGSARYFYDPFVKFGAAGDAATKTADSKLVQKAFVVIDASVEIEPINFSMLDRVHELLKLRCPDAALGNDAGEPIFGLMCNSEDIDKAIEGDEKVYREWLEAKPLALIQKYNMSPKVYRRWAIVSDANQLRFKIKRYVAAYDSSDYGGVAAELDGKAVYIAEAVDPFVADPINRGINGGPLPIENMEYVDAELAICPVFMNDVLTNLFEAGDVNLGSGTHFGAYPSLNGQWGWVLGPQTERDPFQQTGKFYGLFAIHQKPEPRVRDVISFIYRRCKESIRAKCPVEVKKVNPDADVATATVKMTDTTVLRVPAGTAKSAVTIGAGNTVELVLGKGSGPMFIGEDRVLTVGSVTAAVKVVDVTSAPYITVATTTALNNTEVAALFDLEGSTVTAAGVVTLVGKAVTGTLNKAA